MAKDLGLVTAYGYAQAGGYTGTEAEFEMMLANAGRGIVSVELTSTVGYVKTYTITFTDGTTTTFDVTDGEVSQAELDTKADAIVDSASGSIASITDGGDDLPMKSLKVEIVPKQSGSGDPSPSNVRPIEGWSGVEVYRTGVNVWDEVWEEGRFDTTTGVNSNLASNNQIRTKGYTPVLPSTTYRFISPSEIWVLFFDKDKNPVTSGADSRYSKNGNSVQLGGDYALNKTFTTPSDARYMRFYTQTSYGKVYNHDISINYPSTDHDYHPYQGTSYPIPLPSTVYGGTLNVTTGELVINRVRRKLVPSDLALDVVTSDFTSVYVFIGATDVTSLISNRFSTNIPRGTSGRMAYGTPNVFLVLENSDLPEASLEGWKTWVTNNETYLSWITPNPTTVQLTPTEITTLLGNNNIYADCGDVEVEYRADTKLYIDKKINALI